LQKLPTECGDVATYAIAKRRVECELQEEIDKVFRFSESEELVRATLPLVHPDLIREQLGVDTRSF
jgi:hypothetical protein